MVSFYTQVHSKDKREHVYKLEQFENAQTHDDLWNAAQVERNHTACSYEFNNIKLVELGRRKLSYKFDKCNWACKNQQCECKNRQFFVFALS